MWYFVRSIQTEMLGLGQSKAGPTAKIRDHKLSKTLISEEPHSHAMLVSQFKMLSN